MYLEKVNSPKDLKELKISELDVYSAEVKNYIIKVITENGGHLASSLGAIDFTIAMHYVFDCPEDKFLFDVGHQAYAHKIITGRREEFQTIRTSGGLSGFEKRSESEYDVFTMGHSSTSLSAGVGIARARDLEKSNRHVVSVIGDGAFTGGMTYEAMNDIGSSQTKMLIILNDNVMSISKNVGAMSSYLGKLRLSKRYKKIEETIKSGVSGLPLVGEPIVRFTSWAKSGVRTLASANKMFEQLGIKYYGAFDGHNIKEMISLLRKIKQANVPAILHLVTRKGKGLLEAEKDPERFHGLEASGQVSAKKYSDIVSDWLIKTGEKDEKVVAVGAAMLKSTGLAGFSEKYPNRCFDVGIAEQHAVTMSAGLACGGLKPYFAVYSTFLQRGFDQILHDVCIPHLPVRFLIDRSGIVGADGVTHQGIYDLSYLGLIPNMTVLSPKNGKELRAMLDWSLAYDKPLAIRYPKSYEDESEEIMPNMLKWENVRNVSENIYILAVGNRMIDLARKIAGVNIINCRMVKPIDTEFLDNLPDKSLIITLEDNALRGGFGQSVCSYFSCKRVSIVNIGYPDNFVEELCTEKAMRMYGLSEENINRIILYHKKSLE